MRPIEKFCAWLELSEPEFEDLFRAALVCLIFLLVMLGIAFGWFK